MAARRGGGGGERLGVVTHSFSSVSAAQERPPLVSANVHWLYQSPWLTCGSCTEPGTQRFPSFVCSNDTSTSTPAPSVMRAARGNPILTAWNKGIMTFLDPIPVQDTVVIREVVVKLGECTRGGSAGLCVCACVSGPVATALTAAASDGQFNCNLDCQSGGEFTLSLNADFIAFGRFPPPATGCGCPCGNCATTLSFGYAASCM